MTVYMTDFASVLPGEPVDNEQVEQVLGQINGRPSRAKRMILDRNCIQTRHYAIDPQTGKSTLTNAQLTAETVRLLQSKSGIEAQAVGILACGTSSPDMMVPSHAAMVHGELGWPACEIASTAGVCCSSIAALKYAFTSLLANQAQTAVVTGSELPSPLFRGQRLAAQLASGVERAKRLGFEQEFLRWMLSDGAGAVALAREPKPGQLALRIDWIELLSFAGQLETCMYGGAKKQADGQLRGWRDVQSPAELHTEGYLNLTQDLNILMENMIPVAFKRSLQKTIAKHQLTSDQIDWMLPHMSSFLFEQPIFDTLRECGLEIPKEKWFTNLATKGNTGAASMFIILDELVNSGRLEDGQRIVCAIPESGRFSFGYMHLTVIAN